MEKEKKQLCHVRKLVDFDYGGTFNSLKNSEMQRCVVSGDWIAGWKRWLAVGSVVPKEGGISGLILLYRQRVGKS